MVARLRKNSPSHPRRPLRTKHRRTIRTPRSHLGTFPPLPRSLRALRHPPSHLYRRLEPLGSNLLTPLPLPLKPKAKSNDALAPSRNVSLHSLRISRLTPTNAQTKSSKWKSSAKIPPETLPLVKSPTPSSNKITFPFSHAPRSARIAP